MKFFAVTTFICLLVTAIFLTNSYFSDDQKSSIIEETNDLSEVVDETQAIFTAENSKNKDDPSKYQDDFHESLENKHGTPTEFLGPNTDEIIAEHSEKFQHLEATSTIEVTNLVEQALNDYNTKKQNGEDISYFYFYRTYYPKVTALQSEINTAFEKNYSDLQDELEKHGFSPKKAEKFKVEFEEKKKEQMRQLMMNVVEGF